MYEVSPTCVYIHIYIYIPYIYTIYHTHTHTPHTCSALTCLISGESIRKPEIPGASVRQLSACGYWETNADLSANPFPQLLKSMTSNLPNKKNAFTIENLHSPLKIPMCGKHQEPEPFQKERSPMVNFSL